MKETQQCPQCGAHKNGTHRGWCSQPPMMKLPEAPQRNGEEAIGSKDVLGTWWNLMPDWAKKAYQTNPHFNAAIQSSAYQGKTKEEMLWMLAQVMTERGDDLLQKLIRLEQERPLQITVPNSKVSNRQ